MVGRDDMTVVAAMRALLSDMDHLPEETSFRAVLSARKDKDPVRLNEASLGRVYSHLQAAGDKSFAILTSWRQGVTDKVNRANLGELEASVRSAGLGFFKLLGHWKEEGQEKATSEPSLFVPGASKALATKLGTKYNQDAVIYAGPDTNGKVTLVFRDGGEQNLGKFNPGKIAQAYSSLRGRTFTFEGWEYPAQTFVEGLIARGSRP
jgi:hypothetical protein